MKTNFKTARPDTQSASINTNKRHDYGHTILNTTDVGRLTPVGVFELEPGEELDVNKVFANLESMPMLIDSKQSWEMRLHWFSMRKSQLWTGYRKSRYQDYKTIKRSKVNASAVPYFRMSDLTHPQLMDCIRVENGKLVPRSYMWSFNARDVQNAHVDELVGGFNLPHYNSLKFHQKVMQDEYGEEKNPFSLTNGYQPYSNIDQMCFSRSAKNPYFWFKIGKGSIFDCLDGYPSKLETDFGLESLYPHNDKGSDYFNQNFFNYTEISNIAEQGDYEPTRTIELIQMYIGGSNYGGLRQILESQLGLEEDSIQYIYLLVAHMKGNVTQETPASHNVLLNIFVRNTLNDSFVADPLNKSNEFGMHQRPVYLRQQFSDLQSVIQYVPMSVLVNTWFSGLSESQKIYLGSLSMYDFITGVRDRQLVQEWATLYLDGDENYTFGIDDLGVAIAPDDVSCQDPTLVSIGYPNILNRSYQITLNETEDYIDATPLRMYAVVHNQFFTDLIRCEFFEFKNDETWSLFDQAGDELDNISQFFYNYSALESWLIDNEENYKVYLHNDFGYWSPTPLNYARYFVNQWFLPQYVAREEDLFTYIKPECDPVTLANVDVNITEQVGEETTASFNLESERILRRQTSVMYNIMNSGRHDWERQFALTGEYPSDAFLDTPSYQGGCLKNIYTTTLVNQAQTEANPLGFTQGIITENMSCDHVGIKCNEQTLVMCFFSIRPHNSYVSDGISPAVQRIEYADQFRPEFADLAEEDVKGKQLNWQPFTINGVTENHNEQTIGYLPRYTYLKGTLNRVCGDFKDSLKLFTNHLTHRCFEGAVIDCDFMVCKPHDYDDVFCINDGSDRYKLELSFDMSISRALSANPQIKL